MKKVAAAKFKEQCLSILDHLDAEGIVITKHGKPVARLLPAERASADLIGALRGRIRVKGEIETTGVKWNASGCPDCAFVVSPILAVPSKNSTFAIVPSVSAAMVVNVTAVFAIHALLDGGLVRAIVGGTLVTGGFFPAVPAW